MPTPLGHALAGLAVAGLSSGRVRPRASHTAVLILCATAPDLDLVLRLFDGVNHHRGPSHSLGMAILIGLGALALRHVWAGLPGALAIGAAWASHVLLDYLGIDVTPPFGEMALWPLSRDFFIAPIPFFYDVPRSFSTAALRHNAVAVILEVAVVGPVAWLSWSRFLMSKSRRTVSK